MRPPLVRPLLAVVAAVAVTTTVAATTGGVAAGQSTSVDVDVAVGGGAAAAVTEPLRLSADGYGAGVAVDDEGTTHVGWLEPRPGARDVVRYCRVPRPGTACRDAETFTPPGTAPRRAGARDSTPVLVLVPRPDVVVVLTTREPPERPEVIRYDTDGRVRSAPCASDGCKDIERNAIVAYVSNDAGGGFEERVLGDTLTAWGATVLPLQPGTPAQEERLLTYGAGTVMSARVPPPVGFVGEPFFAANLGTDPGQPGGLDPNGFDGGADGTAIAADADRPIVARQGDGVFVRRVAAAGAAESAIVDRSSWAPWERVGAGTTVRLAAGNGRVLLLTAAARGGAGRGWQVLDVTRAGTTPSQSLGGASRTFGAPGGTGDVAFDGTAGFGAAWLEATAVDDDGRFNARLRRYALRFARAGADGRFGAPTDLVRFVNPRLGNDFARNELVRLAVSDDGGGAAVLQRATGDRTRQDPAAIELVIFGTRAPRPFDDVRLTGAEVTQGVQNATPLTRRRGRPDGVLSYGDPGRADARLVQGKPTVLRVYAATRRSTPGTPPVTLRITRGRRVVSTLTPTPPTTALPVSDAFTVPLAQHLGTSQVYTFVIPPVADSGFYTYEVLANPPGVLPAYPECARCRGVDNVLRIGSLRFLPTTTVDILPIELRVGLSANERPRAAAAGPSAVFANAATVLPVRLGVRPWVSAFGIGGLARADLSADERQDEALDIVEWWSDDTDNERSSRFPIGIYPSDSRTFGAPTPQATAGGSWLRGGKSYNQEYLDPASCWVDDCVQALYRDRQPIAVLGDARPTGDTRDLTLIAHEIVHGLGFRHAGTDRGCYTEDDQVGEVVGPLGTDGQMDGIGLDTRSGVPPFTRVSSNPATPATTVYDFMSYCFVRSTQPVPAWVSLHQWNAIGAYFAPPADPRFLTARAARTRGGAARQDARTLVVTASVPAAGGAGRITRVRPDDHAAVPIGAVRRPGPYVLIARDAAGAETFRAALERTTTVEGGGRLDALRGWVPRQGVASVEVVRADGGPPVAGRTASASAPRVRITAPRRGAVVGGRSDVEVRWDASDADGDPLETWVELAVDGRRFRPVGFERGAGRARLPARLFPRTGRARIRVRVLDGFHETAAVSGTFRSLGTPPQVEVLAPVAGAAQRADASVLLRAAAYDDAGRRLPPRSVTWRVGRRVVARGADAAAHLPPGRVRLTAEARDRTGRLGRRTVVVPVTAVKPAFARLTGPGRVRRGTRRVTLQVASTFPATFAIAGRRLAVGPRARRVVVPLPRGRRQVAFRATLRSGAAVTTARITVVTR